MISAFLCFGALIGVLCMGACCAESRAKLSLGYFKYYERNKKAPPSPYDDYWARFL